MGSAVLNSRLQSFSAEKTVDEAGCKRVAATNPVEYLEGFAARRLHDAGGSGPRDGCPVVDSGRMDSAQGRGDHIEVRVQAGRGFNHGSVLIQRQVSEFGIDAFHLKTQAGRE